MKKVILYGLGLLIIALLISGTVLTRDGALKTPEGVGTVVVDGQEFEAFPLPEYAAAALTGPYKSYLVEVAPGIKVHILEMGEGYPVYMQHGVPMSGFLYRRVAQNLPSDQYRMIMPTLVGFGFSSKIPASGHSVENHINWLHTALRQLDLGEMIFVGHDWGGPLGAGALARSPELMKGAVILNTVLEAPKEAREIPGILKAAKTPVLGEFLFEGPISLFKQLKNVQNDPASLSEDVTDLYEKPLLASGNGKAPLAMFRLTVFDPNDPGADEILTMEKYMRANPVPTEIVWGENDPRLGNRLEQMQGLLPHAGVTKTPAGHFLQEEVPVEIAAAIEKVYGQVSR